MMDKKFKKIKSFLNYREKEFAQTQEFFYKKTLVIDTQKRDLV